MTAAAKRPPLPKMVEMPVHMLGAGKDILEEERNAAFGLTQLTFSQGLGRRK